MLYVMRSPFVLRLLTILTILTFFPASVGAYEYMDGVREVVVYEESGYDPFAELPWDTVEELERGKGNLPWNDRKRFEVAAASFELEDKAGSLLADYKTQEIEPFQVADARTADTDAFDALRDEVLSEPETQEPVAIPEDVIAQAIRETPERLVVAQAEEATDELESAVSQLEQEAQSILGTDAEESATSEDVERFILAQAETGNPWEGSTTSGPELLAMAQANLDNNQPVDAALNCLELIDRFPGTLYAVGANTILEGMADEFRKGNFSAQDIAAFEAAMPSFSQLQSLDGKYNILGFHRIKAKNEAKAGNHANGRALLELCISEAQTLLDMDPTNPLQIDIAKVFINSAWEYSPAEGRAAADYLDYYVKNQPRNIGRWAAQYALKKFQGVRGHAPAAARMATIDLMGAALKDTYVAEAIADPTVYGWVKAQIQYVIADGYLTRNRWQDALDKCDEIIANYPSATSIVESAELLKCHIAHRTGEGNLYPAIVAFNNFYQNHSDSDHAGYALWMVGNLYFQSEDYTQAASYFRNVITMFPGAPVAEISADTIDYMNTYLVGTYELAAEVPDEDEPLKVAQMCGPVALQKLLSTQGVNVNLRDLAERTGVNAQGTTMLALIQTAKHYGVTLTGVELASLESLNSPFIAYVNNDHFVMVKDIDGEALTISDSWKEDEVVLAQEFKKTWNGQALIIGNGPETVAKIDIASLAASWGGAEDDPPPGVEDETCGINNNPPPPCTGCSCNAPPPSPGSPNPPPGTPGPPGPGPNPGPPTVGGVTNSLAGSAASWLGYQSLNTGITAPGINAKIGAYVSTLILDEADLALDVTGPMYIKFQRNHYSLRGYNLERRTGTEWFGNNIGKGWYHNWNYHLEPSTDTEAQGQPSAVTVYSENGGAEVYEFDQRVALWDVDVYEPDGRTVSTERMDYTLLRVISTGKYRLFPRDGQILYFSTVDGTHNVARLETVEDPDGNEITLSYDGANGTGKLTKIDTPSGDSRYIQLSYSGSQITKAEIKDGSTVLQDVEYAYNASDELTKVTDDGGQDVVYAYDSDGTYTDSRFITKITDKLGYEYDFDYTFKTHHSLTHIGFAYVIDVDFPNGLTSTYDRANDGGGTMTVTNWDGATLLNKYGYTTGGSAFYHHRKIDLYKTSTTYNRWNYGYTDDRDLTKISRPGLVGAVEYTYNDRGRVSTRTVDGSIDSTWEYSTTTLLATKQINEDGTETEYFYDSDDRLTKITHPSYGTNGWRYEYDGDGNLTKTTTPGGEISTVAYDAYGNPTSMTNPLNHTTSFEYDDLGRRTKVTDHMNNDTEFFYDGAGCGGCGASGGNITKVTDADGNDTEFEYDLAGRRTKSIDPRGIETAYAYDKENRLTKITFPAGGANTSTIAYDKLGRQTTMTDFEGNDIDLYYNFKGMLTKQSDSVGDTTYEYNQHHTLTKLTDAEGHYWKWGYDGNNRLTWTQDQELKTTGYVYDAEGRMTRTHVGQPTGNHDPTLYSYSGTTGLLTKVEYVSGASTHDAEYHYDDEGQLTKVADWLESGGNARLYGFDDAGRLTKVTEPDLNSITYSYDSAGRVTTINDYQSKVTSYTYTDAGRLSTITAPGSKTWDYDYEDGFLTKYSHPNGMTTNYEYDDRSRLTKIEHKDGSTVKQGFTYTLDDDGSVTEVEYEGGETWEYFYDGRNRLTKAERDNSSATLLHRYTYTYDDADNLVTKQIYDGTTTSTDAFAYNTANELTKHNDGTDVVDFEYDAWGRMTKKEQDTTYEATYDYRYGGKLYDVTSDFPGEGNVTYDYGDDGQRKSRTSGGTTTNYYYDGWNVINEKTGSTWTTYAFDKRQPVGNIMSQVDGDPATGAYEYFAHDNLGSTRTLYNQSKTEVANYEYTPYGEDYASSGSASTDYRFTGKGWDSTSALYHFPYRYYGPDVARWIAKDPLDMIDGPNMHAYTGSNPTSRTDPLGLRFKCIPKTGWFCPWGYKFWSFTDAAGCKWCCKRIKPDPCEKCFEKYARKYALCKKNAACEAKAFAKYMTCLDKNGCPHP